ncbi:GDSL-type esterase/lipase family protein [Chitinophaga sp. GbtcB8]|uniref:GDSL-type esterase/lipase family protein n=1 Tax=Chitinophaga sp. GbtcB8 TaxID=2824753 RepID=UPI001C3046FE|nr:GDSL-type esterase/lipase family protein [Chitinophaga sp. GbtcB8]
MKKVILLYTLLLAASVTVLQAQDKPRFWDDVQTIKQFDKMYNPPAHPILFTGSSSIRKWDDLERSFASYVVLNRGIGGAIVNDITFYLNDIVFPYHPRQIVLYVGENDLPDEASTADSVLQRTERLFHLIRNKLPDVPIVYISMKPSPSREKFQQKAIEANALIKDFLSKEKQTVFIDVFHAMLTADGKTRPELFVSDMLHMSAKGYQIWKEMVEPHLLK